MTRQKLSIITNEEFESDCYSFNKNEKIIKTLQIL